MDLTFSIILQVVPDMKFNVLGTQNLTDLRDQINCVNDLAVGHDLSENPDNDKLPYAKVGITLFVDILITKSHLSRKFV